MQWKRVVAIGLIFSLLLTIQTSGNEQAQASSQAIMADLLFTADSFPAGVGSGYFIDETGLVLGETAVYHSPILQAPIPFNAIVPQWTTDIADLELMIRTGTAVDQWQEWTTLHNHNDWNIEPAQQFVGEMLSVPAKDSTHQLIQFRLRLHGNSGTVSQLRLTLIDSTAGPTLEEMISHQTRLNQLQPQATASYPQPFIISRQVWCDNPACNSSSPSYAPVTHLIVHHTLSNNATPDWPAHIRAIWNYHTFGLGWGDIGYNFLIDPYGNIYEGRFGGDDVVGVHANAANVGSMGVALLGDFGDFSPPATMLNATVELLAWKADQRDIQIYESSRTLPNIAWGLPHLMSHRDVYGGYGTECPGTTGHLLLPWLRDEVAARLGQVSPYIYVDESSNLFSRSNTSWFTAANLCGHNLNSYYTLSKTDPSQSFHWGQWQLPIPNNGRYRLEVFIPYCNNGLWDTAGANYRIDHAEGSSYVTINQAEHAGLWVSLGDYDFTTGAGSRVRLTNLTTTDAEYGIWFDAVRIRPLDEALYLTTPTPDSWLAEADVAFQWQISQPQTVSNTRLQVATEPTFADTLVDESWATAVLSHTHTFSQSHPNLYWRVMLDTAVGPVTTPTANFHLDIAPPETAVTGYYWLPQQNSYLLTWDGTDDASGIATYTIEMKTADDPAWQPFITNTLQTSLHFTPPTTATIWFRSQATDAVGHLEAPHPDPGDLNTTEVISLTHAIMLPIVKRN